jgi:membrane associated rhomboid family serine protease
MLQLFANLSARQANTCSTVLAAAGIDCRIRPDPQGWAVWVKNSDYDAAVQAMRAYFRENRDEAFSEKRTDSPPPSPARFLEALFAAAFLLVWHLSFSYAGTAEAVVKRFGASAGAIGEGEVYRAVTALMIHVDAAHLAGNMLGIVVFGAAVAGLTGWGVGWFMILLTGILGNLVNAFMYQSGHLSVGASTAVFGAIGILAGYQVIVRHKRRERRISAWLPLACGVALLGFIGSGENVDITAHLFGMLTGLVMGAGYALVAGGRARGAVQAVCLLLALALIFTAWSAGGLFSPL